MSEFDPKRFVAESRKFLVCLLAALAVLATAISDSQVSQSEWLQIAIAFVTAGGVYFTPNDN